MESIYLDYAAATPMDPSVLEAMRSYFMERFHNPSATYLAAQTVSRDIETARTRIAHWLGAKPAEIVFTAGGTEANNLAIHGVMRLYPDANIVVSAVEHEAVLQPAGQYDCTVAPVKTDGVIDLARLEKTIDDRTVLVSIMYANNELGTIQPLRQASAIIRSIRDDRRQRGLELPLYLHTDACQAGAYLDLHASRHGVDMMTINGGKIYGPKQSGALFVKTGLRLRPLISGGGQESGQRSGTENVAGIVGLAAALDLVQDRRPEESERLARLQQLFFSELSRALPKAKINGSLKHRLPNNVHATFPGQDNERLMMALDERGVQCAVGSACSASSEEPSHVLAAIGLSEADSRSSLRFSLGHQTSEADIKRVVSELSALIQ